VNESEAEAQAATIRANMEGRLNGEFRCPRCGMRSNTREEAVACCEELGPPASDIVSDARYRRP
jgi:tRNA(Ile2) C34 agmatinyltransferase TiaS